MSKLGTEVIDKMQVLMTTAFGLIAALAWNTAISSLFAIGGVFYFLAEYGVWAYAIFVTILVVGVSIYISRVAEHAKKVVE
jgi:hypothetical protein